MSLPVLGSLSWAAAETPLLELGETALPGAGAGEPELGATPLSVPDSVWSSARCRRRCQPAAEDLARRHRRHAVRRSELGQLRLGEERQRRSDGNTGGGRLR